MKKESIGIVITDGVGYRNFVLSNFLNEVVKSYEKVVVFSGIPINSFENSTLPNNIEVIELEPYVESRKVWFFRKLKELSHMYLHKSFYGINDNLKRGYPKKWSKRAIIIKLAYLISKLFHSEKNIQYFEKLQFKFTKSEKNFNSYANLLKNHTAEHLFFTHQRPPYLAPILVAAKVLNISTSAFVFSWDNLASKGRMLGEFDGYLVWSQLMKEELKHFYPNTKIESINIVGTPQFEPYILERYNLSKVEFYDKMNLNLSKKIICYSCADADIGRNDEIHIRAVMSYIENKNDFQLLVRTSPAEDGKRFVNLKKEFPNIIWNFPKWMLARKNHVEQWSQRLPTIEDVKDLKAILAYSDVNVNMLSTMSLDFMLFDKPVINTVFGNENNGLYNDQRFLSFKHLEYVIKSEAVTIAKTEKELHNWLDEAIENPNFRTDNRKEIIDLEIGKPLEGTSKRLVEALTKF